MGVYLGSTSVNFFGGQPKGGGSPSLQTKSKTYTPTTSQQTESVTADSGYDGLSAVNITINAMPSGTAGTPTATKGTVSNHAVSVTPSVTNSTGYIAGGTKTGTAVSVSASELVSGTLSVTSNDTYDVTNYASVNVNVPTGGGGASNFVTGTFTTGSSSGAESVTIPYTGNGYPIAAIVVVEGGMYNSTNTDWYSAIDRYAIGMWSMTKNYMSTSPNYSTSTSVTSNQTTAMWVYKNSTSSATTYSRNYSVIASIYTSENASTGNYRYITFKSPTVMSYFVKGTSYGLAANIKYRYFVAYSE